MRPQDGAAKDVEKLKEDLAYIRFELDDLRSKRYKSGKKKPPDGTPPAPPSPRKRGGLFGHVGWFRKKPKEITRIEEVRIDKCPECDSKDLTECGDTHEHIREDIVLPKAEVTLYRKHRYYCKNCKEIISPKRSHLKNIPFIVIAGEMT